MNISQNFKKKPWLRRVHPDEANPRFRVEGRAVAGPGIKCGYIEVTQDDFLNELSPAAHQINSKYMSTRPIYGPSGEKDATGKEKYTIVGYDALESVPLGWQQQIATNKIAHLANNGFWTASETEDEEAYGKFLSWLDYIGVKDAYREAVYYAERTGDAALYIYQSGTNRIEYDVWSFEEGSILYPQKDENGNQVLYRRYFVEGREMVDVISTRKFETWAKVDETAENQEETFPAFLRSIFKSATKTKSEDGYVLLRSKDTQVGSDLSQVIYFRVPDVSWGPAELTIEALENAVSYVANEVKDSAFPIMFVKSEKVVTLPPTKINGKTIAVKGTTDSLKASDAKLLAPPDASNIAELHIKELRDNIIRSTSTVIIEPEILKQGADSSTSIKILFRPEIEWAAQRWMYYAKPVRQLIEVCKRLVGKVERDIARYDKLRVSIGMDPWVPNNRSEEIKNILDQVYARTMSRESAIKELENQHIGDYERINKEWQAELEMKQQYGAKLDDVNPSDPNINNQAPGKTILQ